MSSTSPSIAPWLRGYERGDLRHDLAAGLTIGAMLVPQAMAYALLAGLPPEVGLYSATIPVLVYAVLGSSRQLAVGPVAIVSLLTASALGPVVEEGSAGYVAAAALLALMVGVVHLAMGAARLGWLVNFLSHSVLVGFTAAAAIIIGFSQTKHLLGISVERREHFVHTVFDVLRSVSDGHGLTMAVGFVSIGALLGLRRVAPRLPAALAVVVGSIVAVELLDLESRGVRVVGDIPDSLPAFGLPDLGGSLMADLAVAAIVITMVGFMESFAVAKVYARKHRDELDANRELIGLGAANVTSGLFGGYPVTGGFSRTAVNDAAGARTPLASVVTAALVLATIVFLTPLLSSLPNAALGAVIVVAVVGLVDVGEMRHILRVKRSDGIGMGVAFVGTLALGIELGIAVAVVASMLVVFARMSRPHTAVLGHVPQTTSYRNVDRFDDVVTLPGIRIVRIDAALSFANATKAKALLIAEGAKLDRDPRALIVDASGINDLDATGAEMLRELLPDLADRGVEVHLSDLKGPVRDVLIRSGIWDVLEGRLHASTHDAVRCVTGTQCPDTDPRRAGIDERPPQRPPRSSHHSTSERTTS